MARLRVEPLGVDFDVDPEETVMEAAQRAGYQWPTVCGGQGTCRTCFLEVLDGSAGLSAVDSREQAALEAIGGRRDRETRLACQVRLRGDAVVRKPGVRPAKAPVPAGPAH